MQHSICMCSLMSRNLWPASQTTTHPHLYIYIYIYKWGWVVVCEAGQRFLEIKLHIQIECCIEFWVYVLRLVVLTVSFEVQKKQRKQGIGVSFFHDPVPHTHIQEIFTIIIIV